MFRPLKEPKQKGHLRVGLRWPFGTCDMVRVAGSNWEISVGKQTGDRNYYGGGRKGILAGEINPLPIYSTQSTLNKPELTMQT